METRKFRIRPITKEQYRIINKTHCEEFCADLVINEGKIVTLHEFGYDGVMEFYYFHLHSNDEARWHGGGMWTVSDSDETLINKVFVEHKPIVLPEELFEL